MFTLHRSKAKIHRYQAYSYPLSDISALNFIYVYFLYKISALKVLYKCIAIKI